MTEDVKNIETDLLDVEDINDKNDDEYIDLLDITPPRSPAKDCPICLEQLENRSYTDVCFHAFCFTCLVEWSKVRAVCPLCKESFKSVVYNVKSYNDYQQHYVESSEKRPNGANNDERFRYRTTMVNEVRYEHIEDDLDDTMSQSISPVLIDDRRHRHRRSISPRSSQAKHFRETVYRNKLWVVNTQNVRCRNISPTFFKNNQACTHRLITWLTRELNVLLSGDEHQIEFVTGLIIELVQRFKIDSVLFQEHIRPFLGTRTAHFIHEFLTFAQSPYDLVQDYDRQAIYNYNFTAASQQNDIVLNNSITISSNNSPEVTPPSISTIQSPDISIQASSNYFSFVSQVINTGNLNIVSPYIGGVDNILSYYGETSTRNTGWDTPISVHSLQYSTALIPRERSKDNNNICIPSTSNGAAVICSSDSEVEIIAEKEGDTILNVVDTDTNDDVSICDFIEKSNSPKPREMNDILKQNKSRNSSSSPEISTYKPDKYKIKDKETRVRCRKSKHINKSAKARNRHQYLHIGDNFHVKNSSEHNSILTDTMRTDTSSIRTNPKLSESDGDTSSKSTHKKKHKRNKHKSKAKKHKADKHKDCQNSELDIIKKRKRKPVIFYSEDSNDELNCDKPALKSVIQNPLEKTDDVSMNMSEQNQSNEKRPDKRSITPLRHTIKHYDKHKSYIEID